MNKKNMTHYYILLSLATSLVLFGCERAPQQQPLMPQHEQNHKATSPVSTHTNTQPHKQNNINPNAINSNAQLLHISGKTMGTQYSVKWLTDKPEESEQLKSVIHSHIEKRLAQINSAMSTYDPASEISVFNKQNVDVAYKISKDFFQTLSIAHQVSEHTQGAFDVTVSPLINLWGFGHKGSVSNKPSASQIQEAKAQTGYEKLALIKNKQRIKKLAPITLNLSAIAKGYAVDALATTLENYKIYNYFIEIGGEVVSKGTKANGDTWKVGIEKPIASTRAIQEVLNVSNAALATSGDYRNYFEENGVRYSHTIDPSTGSPITHKLAAVSVLRATCAEADAYATALMVMGDEKGVAFAKTNSIDALFLIKSESAESGFTEVTTGDFASRILTNDTNQQ